jgi:phospholipid transport system substrate-binding protein
MLHPRPSRISRRTRVRIDFHTLCVIGMALNFAWTGRVLAEAPATDPSAAVKSAVEGVLEGVRADHDASAGDIDAISRQVEARFLPYTDFERTTRLALGEALWKEATPDQQHALYIQFRALLVRTYATELTQIIGSKVQFQYLPVQGSGAQVVVPTHMATNGDDNEIDYRLEKTDKGWRIYDINIMGAWLVVLYKGQFASQLKNGGIDGLIKSLAAHNAR